MSSSTTASSKRRSSAALFATSFGNDKYSRHWIDVTDCETFERGTHSKDLDAGVVKIRSPIGCAVLYAKKQNYLPRNADVGKKLRWSRCGETNPF